MLYWIYEFWRDAHASGAEWAHYLRVLNIFQYITIRAGLATLITFNLSVFLGPWVIRKLISLKAGQPIRTAAEVHELNALHGGKAGTPTMGGLMILGSVLFAVLLCGRPSNPFVAVTTSVMLALGLLGFLDDYKKVKYKKCPQCRKMMARFNYKQRSGVIIDRCGSCGYWLDSGELRQIMEWVKLSGISDFSPKPLPEDTHTITSYQHPRMFTTRYDYRADLEHDIFSSIIDALVGGLYGFKR